LDRDDMKAGWQTRLEKKQGCQKTFRNRTKDGRVIICEWYNTPLIDKQGNVIGVASLVHDITERKHAEEAWIASEERFSKAFNLSTLPMHIVYVKDGKYIAVNDSFLKVTGYTRAEIIGKTGIELNLWASQEDRIKTANFIKEQGRLDNIELGYRRKNGEIRTTLVSAEIMTLGGETCALTIINDITERKQREAALRAS